MLITPDIHLTLIVSADALKELCKTIGFITMCWTVVRIFSMVKQKQSTQEQS